jgi:NAD(P)-dependent dehydrogenase (short-subunit alcohol dehydrogenase family)
MPTPQAPIGSGFGPASTAAEVIAGRDLTGKTAVVTGGYSGIGVETVRAFRSAGAKVVVPARDMAKAKANLAGMADVRLAIMDLLDPRSIDTFAEQFLRENQMLHILVNNAGMTAPPLVRDARGYESQFSANHLGHFQLTCRLWPALVAAHGARVIAPS